MKTIIATLVLIALSASPAAAEARGVKHHVTPTQCAQTDRFVNFSHTKCVRRYNHPLPSTDPLVLDSYGVRP